MKTETLTAFLALAASFQQVSAGWSDASAFTCPENSCDKCTPQQYSGFDWSDLTVGDFSSYGGFDFEGFTCSNSFAKRDKLTGRDFQSKCITGSASPEPDNCPKASCSDVSSFSIETIEISVEFDVELEFQYGMDDGSTCKQKCSCSSEGTSVKNTQCGGAKNVTVVLPSPPPSKPTCSVGIHSIGFHCPSSCTTTTSAASTPMSYTSPTVASTTTTPVTTTPSSTHTSATVTSTTSTAASSSAPTTAPSSSTTPSSTASSSIPTTAPSSSPVSSSKATSPISSYTPASSASSSSTTSPITPSVPVQSITTLIVDTTVTTCPVTNIHTTGGTTSTEITQTVSTITTTYTSTVCTKCEAATTNMMSASTPTPSVSCPSILPSCLNTWMSLVTDCSSINDYKCFCPNSNLTTQVFACLSAHGASDSEISAAQIYFQGICAEYVTQNPAIVTAASSLTATATISGPVTTIKVYTTVVVPCTQSNGPASTTTTISTAVTVPQVVLTTVTGTSVGLYQGTPAPLATTATTMATMTQTYGAVNSTSTTTAGTPKFTGAASRLNVAFSVVGAAFAFSFFAM